MTGRGWCCLGWRDASGQHGCATPGEPLLGEGRCGPCYAAHRMANRPRGERWGSINDAILPGDLDAESPRRTSAVPRASPSGRPRKARAARPVAADDGVICVTLLPGIGRIVLSALAYQALGAPTLVVPSLSPDGRSLCVMPGTVYHAGRKRVHREGRIGPYVSCPTLVKESGCRERTRLVAERRAGTLVAPLPDPFDLEGASVDEDGI